MGSYSLLWVFLFHYLISVHRKKSNAEWSRSRRGPCHFCIYSFWTILSSEKNYECFQEFSNSQTSNSPKSPFPPSLLKQLVILFILEGQSKGFQSSVSCLSQLEGHESGRGLTGRFWIQTSFWLRPVIPSGIGSALEVLSAMWAGRWVGHQLVTKGLTLLTHQPLFGVLRI